MIGIDMKKFAKQAEKLVESGENKIVRFNYVINSFTGHYIKPLNNKYKKMLKEIEKVAKKVIDEANKNVDFNRNIASLGFQIEPLFAKAINEKKLYTAKTPTIATSETNPDGSKTQSTGYPDLYVHRKNRFWFGGKDIYLEIKTTSEASINSTAPSFSWQLSQTGKVLKSIPHILLSFKKDENQRIIGIAIRDLRDLEGDMIIKFISNNKRVYDTNNRIPYLNDYYIKSYTPTKKENIIQNVETTNNTETTISTNNNFNKDINNINNENIEKVENLELVIVDKGKEELSSLTGETIAFRIPTKKEILKSKILGISVEKIVEENDRIENTNNNETADLSTNKIERRLNIFNKSKNNESETNESEKKILNIEPKIINNDNENIETDYTKLSQIDTINNVENNKNKDDDKPSFLR